MTGIELALSKAIEGGWKNENGYNIRNHKEYGFLLDKDFWQALSKSEGWGETEISMDDYTQDHPFMGGTLNYCYSEGGEMTYKAEGWKYQWHRFIDHLAEGRDPNDFFNSLLSK